MALLLWNARGGCSALQQRELHKILHDKEVEVFRVVETKVMNDRFTEGTTILGDKWMVLRNNNDTSKKRDSIS